MRECWLRDYELLADRTTVEKNWTKLLKDAEEWNCCGELARALELTQSRSQVILPAEALEFTEKYCRQPLSDWQERRLKATFSGWGRATVRKKITELFQIALPPRQRIRKLYPGSSLIWAYVRRWTKWLKILFNISKNTRC
ncbi:MAG: hypothetical protein WCJ49_09440 [Deltaproteobacteria bacterium]